MKEKNKVLKISVLTKIGFLFLVSTVIIITVTTIISHKYWYDNSLNYALSEAKAAVVIGESALSHMDPDGKLETDKNIRKNIHDEFRLISKEMDCKYLYLFKLAEDGTRTHLISAGSSDEDDRLVTANGDYDFGHITVSPITDTEAAILKGDRDGGYKIVNNEYGNVIALVRPVFRDGKVYALLAADYSMDLTLEDVAQNILKVILIASVLFALIIALGLFLIHRSILSPLKRLSLQMENFLRDRETTSSAPNRRIHDEITDIESSFETMATEIKQYLSDVERLTTEKVAGEVELSVAKRIQDGIVRPRHSVAGTGYEASAFMHPAREIGGDFYDIIKLEDGRVAFLIGDVSGKGVTAAIFMVLVRSVIRDRIMLGMSPADTLLESNALICSENPEGMFATVFLSVCDPRTGKVEYANAGHNKPFIVGTEVRELDVKSGIALGLFEDADIYDEEVTLEEDTGILLYTDGVSEAVNGQKEQFGIDRICSALAGIPSSAEETINILTDSLKDFIGTAAQFDDITALVYFRKKPENELVLKPEISEFAGVKERIFYDLPDTPGRKNIILACEEWFANIVMHSKADRIRITPMLKDQSFSIEFADNGLPFDPVSYDPPEKDFDDLATGGMGIGLIKDIAEEMRYELSDDQNKLLLIFKEQ
ncbi:MAG: SpoIIE family protein phosphatase [Lachnospiraceae bacterium]|nr:SpoIIE family protein phosphatase [Lachnospiraceae bacterium]